MSNPVNESPLAKYKVWLVPILAVLLLGVIIYNNIGPRGSSTGCGSAPAPLTDYPTPTPVANSLPPVVTGAPAKTDVVSLTTLLPKLELATALKANPFVSRIPFQLPRSATTIAQANPTLPENSSPEIVETESPELEIPPPKPPALNVTGVFRKGGRMAAMVDDRIIFPGETIAEGWRLIAIDARGLVLEPDPR